MLISFALGRAVNKDTIQYNTTIGNIEDEQVNQVIQQNGDLLSVLMGKHPDDAPFETMIKIWPISSKYIANMYRKMMRTR